MTITINTLTFSLVCGFSLHEHSRTNIHERTFSMSKSDIMDNKKMTLKKHLKILFVLSFITALIVTPISGATTSPTSEEWVTGDFHTHTYISDGSYPAAEVAKKALEYGLDWYASTDHGGLFSRNDAGEEVGDRFRWQTILWEGSDKVFENRKSIMQFNGFELNAPGHEHASVGIIGDDDMIRTQVALVEYLFDASDSSTPDDLTWDMRMVLRNSGMTKNMTNNHAKSLEAAKYLQENFPTSSYFLPNHPTRALAWTAKDFRELNDVAPDVFFGAEFLPGHQKSSFRGGLGYFTYYDNNQAKNIRLSVGSAESLEEMVDDYLSANEKLEEPLELDSRSDILASLHENIPKQRTYGGADYMAATIGGVWDSLLSEGRNFWIFGNSDFHSNESSEPDFWPGEYTKLYTYVNEISYQGILDGMRSGNSYSVFGDLIDYLDFRATANGKSATMGETLTGAGNGETVITISFSSPSQNNANSDGRDENGSVDDKPIVHHIDLIAGAVTGKADDYNIDSVSTTKVIQTFTKADWQEDENGICTITFEVPSTVTTSSENMYYRLRGTNLAQNTRDLTDAQGNPLIDTPVDAVKGTNNAANAFSDLWFYSNPIFVYSNEEIVSE